MNAEQPTPGFGLTAAALSLVAEITASTKYLEIAQKIAETIISSPLATPTVVLNARVSLALLASQKSDRSIAREQYAAIEPLRSQQCIRISASLAHAVIDRVLGRLAHTIGDTDQAKTHFEDATAFCHTAGYRPELAWTCYDYADMLLTGAHGRGPLHSAKASALLEESLSISTDLGMRPLMERVSQRLERVHILPETSSAYPDGPVPPGGRSTAPSSPAARGQHLRKDRRRQPCRSHPVCPARGNAGAGRKPNHRSINPDIF